MKESTKPSGRVRLHRDDIRARNLNESEAALMIVLDAIEARQPFMAARGHLTRLQVELAKWDPEQQEWMDSPDYLEHVHARTARHLAKAQAILERQNGGPT